VRNASNVDSPFRTDDYVLYNLTAPTRRTDESSLAFYTLYERAKIDAYKGGDDNWKAAKATFSELWQQMMVSPELTSDQADELFAKWKQDLLDQKKKGESDRLMSSGPPHAPDTDPRLRPAVAILDL
jgi:hypothetical protein